MWNWDQGRLDYFQFDELRKIAKFAIKNDLRRTDRASLAKAVGLPFKPDDPRYKPWRNYGRTFQLAMIAMPDNGDGCHVTDLGKLLADDGRITTDEYFHFFAEATTDPSPALKSWDHRADLRYPLLFALRYLLARASQGHNTTRISQILGAYETSGFRGDEDQTAYLGIILGKYVIAAKKRQASESIKVLAQISYLSATRDHVTVSLAREDATNLFNELSPVGGRRRAIGAREVERIAALFPSATAELDLDYPATAVSDTEEAGFSEGGRVKRTHLTIERNGKIRAAFFEANPQADCDFCGMDTNKSYPWTPRVLEVHHLLPLCSGARTSKAGTILDDLVANCPTCHRAVHRFYSGWLKKKSQRDFSDASQAREVYRAAKAKYEVTANAGG